MRQQIVFVFIFSLLFLFIHCYNKSIASEKMSVDSENIAETSEKVVTRINGTVDGRKGSNSVWLPIFTSKPLINGDWARTGMESLAKIYLEGGRHFVKMYENTLLEMSRVEKKEAVKFIQLKQTLGKIKVSFDKFLGKTQKMEVHTPTATLAVRGTSFISQVFANGLTIIQVFSGSVDVAPSVGKSFQLHGGQGAVIEPPQPLFETSSDASQSSSDTSDNTTSSSTSSSKTSDTSQSSPDASQPSPDASQPSPDASQPSPDASQPSLDASQPSIQIFDVATNDSVASSSLINDNISYATPPEEEAGAGATTTTDAESVASAEETPQSEPSTTNSAAIDSSTVQTLTNTNNMLTASFDMNFSEQFGNATLSQQQGPAYFSFSKTFSASGLEGRIFVWISQPTFYPSNFGDPRSFKATIYPGTDPGAPPANIDSSNSFVDGVLSYTTSGGSSPTDYFSIGLKGDIKLKLNDPQKSFAAFFDLDAKTLDKIFDPGGKAEIGGNMTDPQTAKDNPQLLSGIKVAPLILLNVKNIYNLPLNGFSQSH